MERGQGLRSLTTRGTPRLEDPEAVIATALGFGSWRDVRRKPRKDDGAVAMGSAGDRGQEERKPIEVVVAGVVDVGAEGIRDARNDGVVISTWLRPIWSRWRSLGSSGRYGSQIRYSGGGETVDGFEP